MKIDTDILRQVAHRAIHPELAAKHHFTLLAAADLIDKLRAAGFITPDGEAVKVHDVMNCDGYRNSNLTLTKDGKVFFGGALWRVVEDQRESRETGYAIGEIYQVAFYMRQDDVAEDEQYTGPDECYSTREAAEAARKGGVFNG